MRVIGGTWRSRRITFPSVDGLRPTPDRVRETLFNWLRWDVEGADCLDLFAGSGVLGIEAASRGAKRVVLVENDNQACSAITANLNTLDADHVLLLRRDVMKYLEERPPWCFDLIFLDPPFRQGFVAPCVDLIQHQGWVSPGSKIYIESESEAKPSSFPPDWKLLKSKKFGTVGSYLFEK